MQPIESILADAASIAAIRRDIHAHPELAYQEQRTSDLIAQALTDWGIPVHRGLGRTGLVGVVSNGSSAQQPQLPLVTNDGLDAASLHRVAPFQFVEVDARQGGVHALHKSGLEDRPRCCALALHL